MDVLVVVLAMALLLAVIAVVSAPLRAMHSQQSPGPARRAELQAQRDAKYREIRDAELDHRTGKLSREDYQVTDGTLRAEAVAILNQLSELEREESGGEGSGGETSGGQQLGGEGSDGPNS